MQVKVATPLEKEIRRGAFLAGSDGKKYWVDLKYKRLPIFCHYCGLGMNYGFVLSILAKQNLGLTLNVVMEIG